MWRNPSLLLLAWTCVSLAQVSTDTCVECFIEGIPEAGLTIGWAEVEINTITVATATIVIDTAAGLTSTKTAPIATVTADAAGNPILDDEALEKFWSSQIRPASALQAVNVVDGTPTATVTARLPVGPASTTVVTGTIVWPAKYERYGLAINSFTANTCSRPRVTLAATTIGLQPTATDGTYSNPYDYPLNLDEWKALFPSNDCSLLMVGATSTGIAITQARAITDTVTSYGVFANRQEPTPASASSGGKTDDDGQPNPTAGSGVQGDDSAQPSGSVGGDGSARPSGSAGGTGSDGEGTSSSPSASTSSVGTSLAPAGAVCSPLWLLLGPFLGVALW